MKLFYAPRKPQHKCIKCKKSPKEIKDTCETCGDFHYQLPEGWKFWPTDGFSLPSPVICPDCYDEDEYNKEQKKIEDRRNKERCSECGSKLVNPGVLFRQE